MLYNHEFWVDLAPWGKYNSDVIITVDHVLTEPTCPMASVEFELDRCGIKSIAYGGGNTFEEAINDAVTKAIARLEVWKHLTVTEILEIEQEQTDLRYINILNTVRAIKFKQEDANVC